MAHIQALLFDVFGTVVDWRSCVAREVAPFLRARSTLTESGCRVERALSLCLIRHLCRRADALICRRCLSRNGADPYAFADAWRRRYAPAMEEVRAGRRGYVRLDVLHRENLLAILPDFGIDPAGVPDAEIDTLNHAWHRLDPWPDSVAGLTRLKTRFIIAPLSNGNISLMIDIAKRAGLPWDAILGAELVKTYKPRPEAYLGTADILGLPPSAICMVAAHNSDLAAARACGLRTAFIPRPTEHGLAQTTDLAPAEAWDYVADDITVLADQLGA